MIRNQKDREVHLRIKKRFFNSVYLPFIDDYKTRVLVFYGGAGSGKSVFAVQRAIIKAMKSKRKTLVVRKTMASIRDSIFAEFKQAIVNFQIHEQCKVRETSLSIILPNGSEFIFKGIDDQEKIKSIQGIDDIVIEEASELTYEDYLQLQLRLRSQKADNQIVLMYNPVSKANWVYKEFHDPSYERPSNCKVLKTTYKDNKFLPQSYIDNLEQEMKNNSMMFKVYALGEFASLGELIFTNHRQWDFGHNNPLGYTKDPLTPQELMRDGYVPLFGLDFGFTADPTAFIYLLVNKDKRKIFVVEEFTGHHLLNVDIHKQIHAMGYSREKIIADSASPKSIEELRRIGMPNIRPSRKGNDSVIHGIQFMQGFEIIVHPDCVKFTEELQNYAWQKKKGGGDSDVLNKPIDEYNHLMDATRYALEPILPKGRMGSISKSAFGL